MRALALLGLLAVGCGDLAKSPVSPDVVALGTPAEALPLVVHVQAEGVDTYALRVALVELEKAAGGTLRIERGIGPRQITLRLGAVPRGAANAQPAACPCTGEGEITLGSWPAANNEAVLLHELAHLFGLLHSEDPADLMFEIVQHDEKRFSSRDVARLRAAIANDADAAAR